MGSETPVALIVDDNDVVRLQLKRALANEGIDCDVAVDGDDALRKFAEHHYSLVVTDMRMPKVHGHALAVQLLDMPLPPRIVAVTAVTDKRLVKDLKARGVDEVLHKPLNYYGLARTAKRLLDEEEARQLNQDEMVSAPLEARAPEPLRSNSRGDEERGAELQALPECSWMQLALDYIDWRRIPNPMSVQDSARTSRLVEAPNVPAIVEEIAIVIGIGDQGQPMGVPFKVMIRMLSGDRITMFHTTRLDFPRVVVLWRTRHSGRAMAILNDLQRHERQSGWEVVGSVAGNSRTVE